MTFCVEHNQIRFAVISGTLVLVTNEASPVPF